MIGLTFSRQHTGKSPNAINWKYITIQDRIIFYTMESELPVGPDAVDGYVPAVYYYYNLDCVCVDDHNDKHFARIEESELLNDLHLEIYALDDSIRR